MSARSWFLGALCALAVANVLIPADALAALQGAGFPIVGLTLLLAAAICGWGVVRGGLNYRFGFVEVGVVILVTWQAVSWWAWSKQPGARAADNSLWQWIGLGVGYLLARQLLRTPRECRALVAIMFTLCVFQATYALWSRVVEAPRELRRFEEMKAAGPGMRLPGTGAFMDAATLRQYEDRLRSPEPLGGFALTNSLAGLLAPWMIIWLGIAWTQTGGSSRSWRVLLTLFAGLIVMAICLWLTHSRTAQLAAVAGVLMLVATRGGQRRPTPAGWVLLAAALLIPVVTALVLGFVEILSLTGARQSMLVRMDYWRSTWQMIADGHWLFGVGPGRFRDQYPLYMLPQASESIADPHNVFLEVWATSGTIAFLALVGTLIGFYGRVFRSASATGNASVSTSQETSSRLRAIIVGAGVGFLLAFVLGYYFAPLVVTSYAPEVALVGGLGCGGVLILLWPWMVDGRMLPGLAAIGAAVLLFNLLAAGGVAYPGVAGSLWLLLALGLCLLEAPGEHQSLSRPATILLAASAVALAATFEWTALNPVMSSQMALGAASDAMEHSDAAAATTWLLRAADADPKAEQPRHDLAQQDLRAWLDDPTPERVLAMRRSYEAWLQVAPGSSSTTKLAGDRFLQIFRKSDSNEALREAVRNYRLAAERAPSNGLILGHQAWAEHLAGDHQQAARDATESLRLDAQVRDPDYRLASPLLRIADPAIRGISPDLLMKWLAGGGAGKPPQ